MASRIKGITVEMGGDTTKLQDSLKKVDQTISGTQSKLKDLNKLLKLDPSNTELLSQKQKALKEAISATKDRLDALKEAQVQAKQQLENGTLGQDKYDALQREIAETETKLKSLTTEYRNFGSVAAQQIAHVGKQMKDLGDKMSHAGQTLTTTVTLPIAAAGAAAVKNFAEVDKTMTLANQTMGNTADQAALMCTQLQKKISTIRPKLFALEQLFDKTKKLVSAINLNPFWYLYPKDYQQFDSEQRAALATLINHTRSLGKLINERIV